ncbi:MAG TPA: hypothetical protein VF713_22310 [Thermoanaerobaculia bacterium]
MNLRQIVTVLKCSETLLSLVQAKAAFKSLFEVLLCLQMQPQLHDGTSRIFPGKPRDTP